MRELATPILDRATALDAVLPGADSQEQISALAGVSRRSIIATQYATGGAPVDRCQDIGKVVGLLEQHALPGAFCTPEGDQALPLGTWRSRVLRWLSEEALPLWLRLGVDKVHGGYFDALTLPGKPLQKPKRMRTMARQIYAFAVAANQGWSADAREEVSVGLDFIERYGRTASGGWVRTLNGDGSVADGVEDLYDTACVLLALAHAHQCGNRRAIPLAQETLHFLEENLKDRRAGGYLETLAGGEPRRSNPHMHLLEAYLAWHEVTGDASFLQLAEDIVRLFKRRFFDPDNWAVREFFAEDWSPAPNNFGEWTDPGHHFEWAALLADFGTRSGETISYQFTRKLYASAVASGLNRTTGLAFAAVSRCGAPIQTDTRSWRQAEAIRAAIAMDRTSGTDLKPEIEARIGRLFRWHIAPAPSGLWIDHLDDRGVSLSPEVPASILYHLTNSFSNYLSYTADQQRT